MWQVQNPQTKHRNRNREQESARERERGRESAKCDKNFSISYAHNFIKQSQTDGRIVGQTDRWENRQTDKQANCNTAFAKQPISNPTNKLWLWLNRKNNKPV